SLPQQWTLNRSLRRVTLYRSFVQYTKVESRLQVRNDKSCGLLSSKEAILVVQRVLERTRSPFLAPHQPCPAFFMSLHRLARPLIDNQQRSLKVLLVVLIELRQFKAHPLIVHLFAQLSIVGQGPRLVSTSATEARPEF